MRGKDAASMFSVCVEGPDSTIPSDELWGLVAMMVSDNARERARRIGPLLFRSAHTRAVALILLGHPWRPMATPADTDNFARTADLVVDLAGRADQSIANACLERLLHVRKAEETAKALRAATRELARSPASVFSVARSLQGALDTILGNRDGWEAYA